MKKYLFIFSLLISSLLFCIYGFSDNTPIEAGIISTYNDPQNKATYIDRPWQDLITLQSGPSVREKYVTSFEDGEYIGVKYGNWNNQKGKVTTYTISIIDLKTGKKVYETNYERAKKENRFLCINEDIFTYTLQDPEKDTTTIHRVDLKTEKESKFEIPSYFVSPSLLESQRAKRLIIREPKDKKLYIFDPIKNRLESYPIPEDIKLSGIVFGDTNIIFYSRGRLKWGDIKNKKISTITEGLETFKRPTTFMIDTPIFPILIKDDKGDWYVRIYDGDGEVIKTYNLSDYNINALTTTNSSIRFKEIANYKDLSIFEIRTYSNEDSTYYSSFFFFDKNGDITKTILNKKVSKAKTVKTQDGHIIFLYRTSSGEWKGIWKNERFTLPGYDESYIYIIKASINELFLGHPHRGILKYSLTGKEFSGLYLFCERIVSTKIYNNRVYVVLSRDKKETKIVSFSEDLPGWIPFHALFSPVANGPGGLYESTCVKVDIVGWDDFYDNICDNTCCDWKLKVEVDKGTIEKGYPDYIWHTPFTNTEEKAKLILSLGPVKKEYLMTVKRPKNALELTIKDGGLWEGEKWALSIRPVLKNRTNTKIDNLRWQIKTENLKEVHKSLPSEIEGNTRKNLTIYGTIYPENVDIAWNGYIIPARIKIALDHKWGHIEKEKIKYVHIKPKYSFYVRLMDQDNKVVTLTKNDIKNLKVFFKDSSVDITERLNIKLSDSFYHTEGVTSGTLIKVEGISPGFPGKPLRLTISYRDKRKDVELAFRTSSINYTYSPPIFTLDTLTKTTLKVNVKSNGKPLTNYNIEITNDKKTYKTSKVEDIKEGNWKVKIWKYGYIPTEKIITVKKNKENIVNIELKKFVGIIFNLESYYKSMNTDKKTTRIKYTPGLTKVTDLIYILPEGEDSVSFGTVYKIGYPDTYAAKMFGEDKYSVSVEVEVDNRIIFTDYKTQGKNIRKGTLSDLYKERGYIIVSQKIEKPTMFRVRLTAKADTKKEEEFILWIFPANWNGYEKQVKEGIIIYGYKGNKLDELYSFAENAKKYLTTKAKDPLIMAGLMNIVWYGMESLDFLKGAMGIPDFGLKDAISEGLSRYIDTTFEKRLITLKALADEETEPNELKMKNIEEVEKDLKTPIIGSIAGEMFGIISTIKEAGEWAQGIDIYVKDAKARPVVAPMLRELGRSDNLTCITGRIKNLKRHIKNIINAFEKNRPEKIKQEIEDIKRWVIGAPLYEDIKACGGHSLLDIFGLEFYNIIEWKSGKSYPNPGDEGSDTTGYTNSQKYIAAKYAMGIYEPVITKLFYIIAPVIDVCIMDDENPN